MKHREQDEVCRLPHPKHKREGTLIHPGSGGVSKMWPIERFFDLAEHLPAPVHFIIGPAEHERGFVSKIVSRGLSVVDTPTISEAVEMLAGKALYVGNDSGMSHCAAMCATPTVALFGPSDPVVWRPLGPSVRVLESADGKMTGISVDEVLAAVRSFDG